MKKFFNITLITSLIFWFFSAIYLSVFFLIGVFIDVTPKHSKTVLALSFLWVSLTLVVNKYITKSDINEASEDFKKVTNCKSCKKK